MINIKVPPKLKDVDSQSIAAGETFRGTIGTHHGIFYKSDSRRVVQLDMVGNSWDLDSNSTIHNYQPVDLEITVIEK